MTRTVVHPKSVRDVQGNPELFRVVVLSETMSPILRRTITQKMVEIRGVASRALSHASRHPARSLRYGLLGIAGSTTVHSSDRREVVLDAR